MQQLGSESGEGGVYRNGPSRVLQIVPTVEPCWLSLLWGMAQVWSILKFLRDLVEVAGSSSDLSHLLASTRYLYQTVEVNIFASLQWWKICFISLYGVTCSPGMQSGKAKMRGTDWGAQHNFAMWREERSLHLERQVDSMPFTVLKRWWFTHIGEGKKTSPQQLALVLLQAELIHRV